MSRGKWLLTSLILLCWALASTVLASYYYLQLTRISESRSEIAVNLLIDYGNGTRVWFNTTVPSGYTLLDLTEMVAEVNSTFYEGMGSFVNSINGVENKHPWYWMWWMWVKGMGWVEGPVAADKYVLSDGETVCWYYEDTSITPLPKPKP